LKAVNCKATTHDRQLRHIHPKLDADATNHGHSTCETHGLGLHPVPMLGDPRLGVRFGFEYADPGRMTVRDADLYTECTVVERDHSIGRFGVRARL
jgi:hypothetical protein